MMKRKLYVVESSFDGGKTWQIALGDSAYEFRDLAEHKKERLQERAREARVNCKHMVTEYVPDGLVLCTQCGCEMTIMETKQDLRGVTKLSYGCKCRAVLETVFYPGERHENT